MNSPTRTLGGPPVPQLIAELAAMRVVHAAFSWFQVHEHELRRLQLEISRIPAPPFGEAARANWLRDKFVATGLEKVEIDEVGNVIALLPGIDDSVPGAAISAHLDTVFPSGTDINVREDRDRIYGPGVSDK